MAHLITALALSGACDGLGNPVASGQAWFFEPGTTSTQKTVYSDPDGLSPMTQPVQLDASGRATVYTNGAVRLQVEGADQSVIQTWDRANTCEAKEVEVENAGWTGTVLSGNQAGSQAAGGRTVLDTALSRLYASTGGVDGQYQIVTAAGVRVGAARSITKAIAEISVNVKSFTTTNGLPVAGDGVQVDTSGIQAAVNYVIAAGGGTVYFPPGTYLIDQTISIGSAPGIVLRGAGLGTVIKNSNSTANTITMTTSSACEIRNMYLTTTSASTGYSISASGASGLVVDGVRTDGSVYGVYLNNTTHATISGSSFIDGSTAGLSGTTALYTTVIGGTITKVATSGFSNATFVGSYIPVFAADSGSGNMSVIGCSTAFTFSGGAQPSNFFQYGNSLEGQTINVATSATATAPDLANGDEITINANSGGAGTVTVPAILNPPARRNYRIVIKFVAAAGGNVTFSMNAQFKINGGGTTIAVTDLHTTVSIWEWDIATSKFREISRGDTTT